MRVAFVWLLLPLLAGCAGAPSRPPAADPERAWSDHLAQVQGLNGWQLSGRLALRAADEGWHASLDWRQDAGEYRMRIRGPLGSGSVQLQGDADRVLLRTDDGGEAMAANPERLLYNELGWRVPVSSLRYWVTGVPAPGPARRQLDEQGHLARLWQDGWDIRFLDYARIGGVALPGKVFASQGDAEVRLVIGNWNLAARLTEAGA